VRAVAKVEPESSISQTWVTGASFVFLGAVLVGVVEGADVPEVLVGVAATLVVVGALDAFVVALDSLAAAGVACRLTGGGWTAAGLELSLGCAVSVGSSGSSWPRANEELGAGPIAAPTATPIASIAAASAAVIRAEGMRGGDFPGIRGEGVPEGDSAGIRGDDVPEDCFSLSGVLFIEWGEIIGNLRARSPKTRFGANGSEPCL
jgi:hypothetical protein